MTDDMTIRPPAISEADRILLEDLRNMEGSLNSFVRRVARRAHARLRETLEITARQERMISDLRSLREDA